MLLYITARRMALTPPIRQYIEDRLIRSVERHAGSVEVMRMEVQLDRPSNREARYGCHVLLNLAGRSPINIREEARDLYEAIDVAEKRLVNTLVDHRERVDTLARYPTKYYAAKVVLGERELLEEQEEIEEELLGAPFAGEEEQSLRELIAREAAEPTGPEGPRPIFGTRRGRRRGAPSH